MPPQQKDIHIRKSWIIKTWPGKADELQGMSPSLQVITSKKCVYVKPVDFAQLPIDKFGGCVISWSRFNGSLKSTLEFAISYGFWKWQHSPQ